MTVKTLRNQAGICHSATVTGTRLPALDGLRGVAISLVLLFHWQLLSTGLVGVDVFFVLSGYLITGLLVDEHQAQGRIDYRRFYRRRARRLGPPLLATILLVLAAGIHTADESRQGLVVLAVLLYVTNFQLGVLHLGAFSPCWSLAVEEQFYLAWPSLTRQLLRRHAPAVLIGAAGVVMTARLLIYAIRPDAPVWVGQLTPLRIDGLLLGAAVALFVRRGVRASLPIGAAGVLLLAAGLLGLHGARSVPLAFGFGYTIAAAGTALLLTHLVTSESLLAKPLEWRPLAGLGRVSYGVYLYHWPVLCLVGVMNPTHTGIVIDAIGTAALTAASWRWLERPGSLSADWLHRPVTFGRSRVESVEAGHG